MSAAFDLSPRAARGWLYATAAYLGVYLLFWTVVPLLLHQEPPIDNFEQLNWALHPALGYVKHPPLPTLLLWLFEQIAPAGIRLTYALGATQVLFTLTVAFWLGSISLDEPRARLGALAITCISYHTLRMHFYNHNTALLCATAASMLCVWQAVHGRGRFWWAALGMAWAAGMLSKYQMALTIACNLAFAANSLRSQPELLLHGVACASAVAVALFAPHMIWLVQHDFPTFHYAASTLGASLPFAARWDSLLRFAASQLLRLAPAMGVLLMLERLAASPPATRTQSVDNSSAIVFWAIHAFGPLLLMAAMAELGGVDLEMHWGSAFLWTLPLWYLSTARGACLGRLPIQQSLLVVVAVQVLLMCGKLLFPNV